MAELGDRDLWLSVEATVRQVLLPAISDPWAAAAAAQLAGLAAYAADRPPDQRAQRAAELAEVLDRLRGNDLVDAHWSAEALSGDAVLEAVGRVLAAAVTRDDRAGDEVRARLRPVVVRQLDDELAVTGRLVDVFRGKA